MHQDWWRDMRRGVSSSNFPANWRISEYHLLCKFRIIFRALVLRSIVLILDNADLFSRQSSANWWVSIFLMAFRTWSWGLDWSKCPKFLVANFMLSMFRGLWMAFLTSRWLGAEPTWKMPYKNSFQSCVNPRCLRYSTYFIICCN